MSAPPPPDASRHQLIQDVLSGGPAAYWSFDRIARLATRVLDVPVALVTLLPGEGQVFAGCAGLPSPWTATRGTARAHPFCHHVVTSGEALVVADARTSPILAAADLPEIGVGAYAGVPLRVGGERVGTFCVVDHEPRAWTDDDMVTLVDLAASARTELELRIEVARRRRAESSLRMLDKAVQVMQLGVTVTGLDGHILLVNAAEAAMHGYAPAELQGAHASLFAPPELRAQEGDAAPRRWFRESVNVRRDGTRFPVRLWSDVLTDEGGDVVGRVTCCEDLTEIRAAAYAAQESEERFQFLADNLPLHVWTATVSGYLNYANAVAAGFFGVPAGRPVGDAWLERVHPDDRMRVLERWSASVRTGDPYEVEFRLRRHDGEYLWHLARATAQRNADGDVLLWFGTNTDITAQKAAAEAMRQSEEALRRAHDDLEARVRDRTAELAHAVEQLRASEREYRGLFENAHDALLILDPATEEILAANVPAETLYGAAPGALVGRTMRDHAVDPAAGERRVRETLAGTGTTHFTTQQRRADGGTMRVDVSAFLVEYRGRTAILSINRDASARHRAEEALRQSEARFRAMFESSAAGIGLVDAGGTLVETNAALQAMLGYDGLAGTPLSVPAHPLDAAALGEGAAAVLEGRAGHWRGELRFLDAAGRVVWAHVTLSAVAGAERYAIAVIENVTERKQAEEALLRSEEMLRHAQKLDAVGRLAGGVAHDFNNLTMAILTHVYALQHGPELDDDARESAVEIQRAAERAAALTKQLLAFSRRQVVAPVVLDLNEAVRDVERMARRMVGEHVELRVRTDPSVPAIRADRGQVEQVLMNLLVNARDAMPEGGRVALETEAAEVGAALPGLPPGRYALLTVADTGHGMEAATRERIFEPFFTTKEVGRGTGLGLATVYGIVEQAGGAVFVESEPGAGARFRVYFPACAAEAEAEPATPPGVPAGRQETVLLVEDEVQLRAPLSRILRGRGYRVLEAGDGEEALSVADRHPGGIDLLLSDVVMPRMGGVELARRLGERRPGMRTLLMSGYAFDELAGREGAEVLEKPVLPDELARRVRAALDREGGA
jgi:PAS domain S-box-containing protein